MALKRLNNALTVVEDLEAAKAFFVELVGEFVQYEDVYRLCYVRGPEGILVGLAEAFRQAGDGRCSPSAPRGVPSGEHR